MHLCLSIFIRKTLIMEQLVVKNNENNSNRPNKTAWWIILGAVILTLINVLVYQCNRTEQPTETVTSDTLIMSDTIVETDTFTYFQPMFQTEYIYRFDTIYTPKDTVQIPLKRVEYKDSVIKDNGARVLYYASVSGYDASLDTLDFMVSYPTITNTEYVTTTIEKTIEKKQSKLGVGVGVGAGYGFFSKQPDIFAGFTLSYRF